VFLVGRLADGVVEDVDEVNAWDHVTQTADHQELAVIAARVFELPIAQTACCTTESLRLALAHINPRKLEQRGWD
jgi:hypothetical protein